MILLDFSKAFGKVYSQATCRQSLHADQAQRARKPSSGILDLFYR